MASSSPVHSPDPAPSYQQLSHDEHRHQQPSIEQIHVTSVWSDAATAPLVSSIQGASYSDEQDARPSHTELAEQAPLTQEWGSIFDTQSKAYLWLCCVILLVGWVFSQSNCTTAPYSVASPAQTDLYSRALCPSLSDNVLWMYVSMYFGGIYAFFQDQVTALLYLIMQAPVVFYRLWWSRSVTKEMRSTVNWKVYFWMGLLDALYNILTASSSPFVNGPVGHKLRTNTESLQWLQWSNE